MKKLVCLTVLFATIFLVGFQSSRAEAYWGLVVNCREWISLRSYRSTQAPRVTTIPLGEWVWIRNGSYYDGFWEADYNGMHGYVLDAYIKYIKD